MNLVRGTDVRRRDERRRGRERDRARQKEPDERRRSGAGGFHDMVLALCTPLFRVDDERRRAVSVSRTLVLGLGCRDRYDAAAMALFGSCGDS